MAPVRTKKRVSDASNSSARKRAVRADQTLPQSGSPAGQQSPLKKKRGGISLAQKQALIDNLQLELTERARRLRAQYNLQAQGLRSRIEIRLNRIPAALRKVKMGDLLVRIAEQQRRQEAATRPPPVPAKDYPHRAPSPQKTQHTAPMPPRTARAGKRNSDEMDVDDKENHNQAVENPKKRARGAAAMAGVQPAQVLSPTSSNSRLAPREMQPPSPVKSNLARPASPAKTVRPAASSNLLSNMVEKARSTRGAATRKATETSTTSSTSASTTGRGRRPAAAAAAPAKKPTTTRTTRRASGVSNSSEGSTATVVKKPAATKAAPATATKRTVMGTIRRGAGDAAAKKAAPAAKPKPAPATTTRSTRVLRKRA